jgi:putative (di)nucleoside polyphosphate hydrolase
VIDRDGFRPNVGIILCNEAGLVFWARRINHTGWQFPQGGIRGDESPDQALFRELEEEVGLAPSDVEILGRTRGWLRYRLPRRFVRRHSRPVCIGLKPVCYLLRLVAEVWGVDLGLSEHPVFERWRWVVWGRPLYDAIFFKRRVYERALTELAPLAFPDDEVPAAPVAAGARGRP